MKDVMNFYKDSKKVGHMEFKNFSKDVGDIYIYGEIASGSEKYDEDDVTIGDFKEKLDSLGNVKELNIYINSPGGSVMTGVNILNILKRHNAIKNVYVDALSASIASVITMCYDNLYVYPTSTLMVHEAMGFYFGFLNKTELSNHAEKLERIEDNMLIPAYMEKASDELNEEILRDLLAKESWLGSKEILKYFKNSTLLEEERSLVACSKFDMLNSYRNTPKELATKQSIQKPENKTITIDISAKKKKIQAELDIL